VKPLEPGASPVALASSSSSPSLRQVWQPWAVLREMLVKTWVIAELEARKLRHDPTELFTRAVQPALWLLIFGQVFARVRAIPTGNLSYLDFMAPGILAQSVLFIAIFYGISVIWERDLGVLHKIMASPAPRAALVSGKALSAGIRGLTQAVIIYALAALLGVDLNWQPQALLGVVVAVILGAANFSLFSLIIACLVKTRERFMGIGQVLTMPLFFASNAIYPLAIMPAWLQVIAKVNPLTYIVDALRALMITNGTPVFPLGLDFAIMSLTTVILVALAARLYPRVIV
jgi:ABC-2 type transport system permease protein